MRQLGVDAYRFSLAWPRVVPGGDGAVNAAGLAFYDRLVDALLEAGHHAPSRRSTTGTCRRRSRTAAAGRTGRRPSTSPSTPRRWPSGSATGSADWATLNEPLCSAWIGHLEGRMAPGLTDITAAVRASYHLQLGHGLAVAGHPGRRPRTPQVGIVNNLSHCEPAHRPRGRRRRRAPRRRAHQPLVARPAPRPRLPGRTWCELYGVELPEQPGDLETIAAPPDWLGLNYYFRNVVADDPDGPLPYARQVHLPGARRDRAWTGRCTPTGLEQRWCG